MGYIGNQPTEAFTTFATQTFSTSATSSYTLDHAVTNENEIALFINNVRQQPGSGKAYTATGTALTLSANTASTDTMYCVFLGRALQTVNPPANSVGSSQIAAEMITGTTALTSEPADTDEFLLSDAGTLKRIDYSLIKGSSTHTLLTTNTITSGVSTTDFTSSIDSTYKIYMFDIINLHPQTDAQELRVRFSQSSSFVTASTYDYTFTRMDGGVDHTSPREQNANNITIVNNFDGASDSCLSGRLFLYDPAGTTFEKQISFHTAYTNDGDQVGSTVGSGRLDSTTAVDGVQFFMGSGNIDSAVIKMYGVT